MTKTTLLLSVGLLTAMSARPVLAQNNTNRANTPSTASTTAASGNWLKQPGTTDWLASHLKGVNVYNNNNDKLGSIDELILDKSGRVEAAVIDVGGFLGMGVHRVAVPFDQLHFQARAEARNNANRNTAAGNPGGVNPANTGLGSTTTGTGVNTAAGANTTNVNNANNGDNNVPDRAVLNMTADQLKAAPEFKYNT